MVHAIPAQAAASLGSASWDLDAFVVHETGDEGVLLATGNENSGVSVFVQDRRLRLDYNVFGEHHEVASLVEVPSGEHRFGATFRRLKPGALITLTVDGRDVGTMNVPFAMRTISSIGMSVGHDGASPVSLRYQGPFAYSGNLRRVDIQLNEPLSLEEREAAAREGMARQ
jgi:arylsulfatase